MVDRISKRCFSRCLERLAAQPFDLGVPPLLRMRLIRVSETEHWLLRSWHHLVCDAASSAIFAHEVGSLYESLLHRRVAAAAGSPATPILRLLLLGADKHGPWFAALDRGG